MTVQVHNGYEDFPLAQTIRRHKFVVSIAFGLVTAGICKTMPSVVIGLIKFFQWFGSLLGSMNLTGIGLILAGVVLFAAAYHWRDTDWDLE